MATIFKKKDRDFKENPGRVDGFRLQSDTAITGARPDAQNLNFDMRRLDPGQYSSLYHFHRCAEELFMIVSGAATLRTPDGLQAVESGDVVFLEMGADGAHQMFNHTDGPCIYLDIRTFTGCDIAEYPDSDSILVVPGMEKFSMGDKKTYFEGEPDIREIWDGLQNKQTK